MKEIIVLKSQDDDTKKAYLINHWTRLDYYSRFVFTKLLTGNFRIGLSQKLMTKALSKVTQIDEDILAYRLMGNWDPQTISFKELIIEPKKEDAFSKPYPFYLAYAIEGPIESLGDISEWIAEHKWDGIRGQIIIRDHKIYVWSEVKNWSQTNILNFKN